MATVLFDELTLKAMECIKFMQVCFASDSYFFRFAHDYDLALAWVYARHRGPTLVSLVLSIETTYGSSVTTNPTLFVLKDFTPTHPHIKL